jgi:hypothetical protein
LTGIFGTTGNSIAAATSAANGVSALLGYTPSGTPPATSVAGITDTNQTTLSNMAVMAQSFFAMDPTATPVFSLDSAVGATAPTITVSPGTSVVGMIGIPVSSTKESVAFIGQGTSGITAMYVNIYKVNTTTGVVNSVWGSPNIITTVANGWQWNYVDLPSANYFTAAQGDWYAIEMTVVGGSYTLLGIQHALPLHPTVFPQALGATRTYSGSPTLPSSFTPSYSNNVPWFALSGTAPPVVHAPDLQTITASGSYTLPSWANHFDVVVYGAGSGGGNAGPYISGVGGNAASVSTAHLTRGADFPSGTTSFTITVGTGGARGTGNAGGASQVVVPTYGTISAAGGIATYISEGFNYGASPGDTVYRGNTYPGGAEQDTLGYDGSTPGGGGAGGNAWSPGLTLGGTGGNGTVYILASA